MFTPKRTPEVPQDRPSFHVAPRRGWINDPNGPLYYNGKYHLFYQHVTEGCEWSFGLVWGHAISSDLVHWEHLPVALAPSSGGLDADGCFSGCAVVDTNGTPTILYTGVRLRSNQNAMPLPPPDRDLQLPFIETQITAVPAGSDPYLTEWTKSEVPFLDLPPTGLQLTGWRDPFILERPGPDNDYEWVMMIGSGLKNEGGTAVVYRSHSLHEAWKYDGLLCSDDGSTGMVWECPIIAALSPKPTHHGNFPSHTLGLGHGFLSPNSSNRAAKDGYSFQDVHPQYTHFFSISPDACTNPTIYWLGRYHSGRFALEQAKGPFRLDLGDTLYAPNLMEDAQGRCICWGWLQERRGVGSYDYAGCLSVPRVLYADYDRLFQEPIPELSKLRTGEAWKDTDITLPQDTPIPLPRIGGPFLDLDFTFVQGTSATVGVLLKSWNASGEGGAAILYSWETNTLEVVTEALDPMTMTFSLVAPTARRIGGPVEMKPGQPLQLRILIDYSCIEVFTGTGEVLSTRVYRGTAPEGVDAGVEMVAFGGTAILARAEAYEMSTIWKGEIASVYVNQQEVAKPTLEDLVTSLSISGETFNPLVPATSQGLQEAMEGAPGSKQEPSDADLFLEVLA